MQWGHEAKQPADDLLLELLQPKQPPLLQLAALLLIVPGVLTDVAGVLLLIPAVRKLAIFWALGKVRFGRTVQVVHGTWRTHTATTTPTTRETPQEIVERSIQQNP